MELRNYQNRYYDAVCDFLIEPNQTKRHNINWNWVHFEWMAEHSEVDKSLSGSIGLWWDNGKIVGASIYDMYLGEAFCGSLPEYADLYLEFTKCLTIPSVYRELIQSFTIDVSNTRL